jgi:hypothetical protein
MKRALTKIGCAVTIAAIGCAGLWYGISGANRAETKLTTAMMPWGSVGGCGSGAGSATLGISQIKWIGKGVSGALFDAEFILGGSLTADSSQYFGKTYDGKVESKTTSVLMSFFYHPPKIADFKLTMPFLLKESTYETRQGPFGDLSLDISRKWGQSGEITTALFGAIPTGNAAIMASNFTPQMPQNQLGGGLFSGGIRASYNIDKDWGIMNFGATYSAGLFAIRGDDYGFDTINGKYTVGSKKFEIARSGWGAKNDAGSYTPDNLGIFADFGFKTEALTHGLSISYGFPCSQPSYESWGITESDVAFPTQAAAQAYYDALETDQRRTVVANSQTSTGTWKIINKASNALARMPSVTMQYSVEKGDAMFPLLLGAVTSFNYFKGFKFASFGAGLGFKFPIY